MPIARTRIETWARIAGQLLVSLLILALPWFYGGVYMPSRAALTVVLALALLCVGGVGDAAVSAWRGVRIPLLCLTAGCALGCWQLTELSAVCSPAAVTLRQEFAAGPSQPAPVAALSLDAPATRRDLALLTAALAAFALGAVFFSETKAFMRLLIALTALGAAVACFGLGQRASGAPWQYFGMTQPLGSNPFGPFIGRNNAGGFLNLCLAAALGVFLSRVLRFPERGKSRRRQSRIRWLLAHLDAPLLASAAALVVIFAGVIGTLSRGSTLAAIVGLLAALAIFGVASRSFVYFWLITLGAAASLALVVWLGQSQAAGSRWERLFAEGVVQESRLQLWKESFDAVQVYRFFGSGLGTFYYAHAPFEHHLNWGLYRYGENQFVEALVVGGYVGFALLVVLCISCLRSVRRLSRGSQSPDGIALATASAALLLTQALSASFDFGWYVPAIMVPFAVWCGALVRRAAGLKSSRQRRRRATQEQRESLPLPGEAAAAAIGRSPGKSDEPVRAGASVPENGATTGKRTVLGTATAFLFGAGLFGGLAWAFAETRPAAVVQQAERSSRALINEQPEQRTSARFDEAIAAQRVAVGVCPDDAEARIRLAELLVQRYLLAGGRDLTTLNAQAGLSERIGNATELASLRSDTLCELYLRPALAEVRRARELCPFNYFAQFLTARLCFLDEPPSNDAWYLERAERLAQGHQAWMYEIGVQHLNAARREQAWAAWRRSWELYPARTDDILPYVLAFADADTALKSVVPDNPEVIMDCARRYLPVEEYPQARREFMKKAVELLYLIRQRTTQQQYLRGIALAEVGDFEEADSSLSSALRGADARGEWYWDLATIRAARGEREAALAAFQRYQLLGGDSALPPPSYLKKAAELLRSQPTLDHAAELRCGELFLEADEGKEAAAAFRRAVASREEDAAAHAGLARALLRTGNAAGAVTAAQRAVELEPKRDELQMLLAQAKAAAKSP